MKDVNKLKRDKADLVKRMKALCELAQKRDDSRMTEQEGIEYINLETQKKKFEDEIQLVERMNNLEMELSDGGKDGEPSDKGDESRTDPNGFATLGEMLIAVRRAAISGSADPRLTRAATGLGKDIPSDGGYLIQENHLAGLERKIFDKAILASKCQKINVGPTSNRLTWNELVEDSRANGSRHGGILGYWLSEASQITASKPKFAKKSLELEKIAALYYATDEFEEDAVGQSGLLSQLVTDELAFLLDDAIFNGTGAGKPLGLLNSASLITVAKETNQPAATIVYQNIQKMRSRLWSKSRANSIWYINQDIETELQSMGLVIGTGGIPVYMPASGLAGSPYDTLFGRPVIPTEYNATLGTKGDIILADLSRYRLIDKNGIKASSSIHVRYDYDETAFKFTYRVNGMPLWSTALTPKNSTSTLSTHICLATRA